MMCSPVSSFLPFFKQPLSLNRPLRRFSLVSTMSVCLMSDVPFPFNFIELAMLQCLSVVCLLSTPRNPASWWTRAFSTKKKIFFFHTFFFVGQICLAGEKKITLQIIGTKKNLFVPAWCHSQ